MELWVNVVEVILAPYIDAYIANMKKPLSVNQLIGQKHLLEKHKSEHKIMGHGR